MLKAGGTLLLSVVAPLPASANAAPSAITSARDATRLAYGQLHGRHAWRDDAVSLHSRQNICIAK